MWQRLDELGACSRLQPTRPRSGSPGTATLPYLASEQPDQPAGTRTGEAPIFGENPKNRFARLQSRSSLCSFTVQEPHKEPRIVPVARNGVLQAVFYNKTRLLSAKLFLLKTTFRSGNSGLLRGPGLKTKRAMFFPSAVNENHRSARLRQAARVRQ